MATTRDTHSGQRRLVGRAGRRLVMEPDAGGRRTSRRPGTGRATWTAGELKSGASWTWTELKAHPYLGGLLAGAAGIAAASTIGVGELAVGIGVGYAAYLVLAKGESPMKALGDAISWEQGELKRATRTSSNK